MNLPFTETVEILQENLYGLLNLYGELMQEGELIPSDDSNDLYHLVTFSNSLHI